MNSQFFLVILLAGLLGFSHLAEAVISVSIDRKPVHVNESFQLFFESDQTPDQDPDFSPLQKEFVVFNSSQSHSISIINGEYRRSIKWTLQLVSRKAGEFTIPAIQFGKDQSKSFKVEIKPATQTSAPAEEGLVFDLSTDKATVPVQGQVVVTLRLLTNMNISAYQMRDLEIEGVEVVVEPLGRATQYQTLLGDKPFQVREKKFALFPQQSGKLVIKPVLADIQLASRSQSLFNPFPESGNRRQVYSQGLNLEISPAAESFDASVWLPATKVQIYENWQGDLNQIVAGEPVTRTITVEAKGLTAAQLPDLTTKDIAGVKQYPDKPLLQNQRATSGITGSREQKIALIPAAAGSYTLPEIKIPWWNVDTQKQEVARLPSRTINVNAAADNGTPAQHGLDPDPVKPIDPVAPIDTGAETSRFWVWLSLLLALGWIVSILIWWVLRGSFTRPDPMELDTTVTSLRQAKRRLKKACIGNNARETREALLQWANCIEVDRQIIRLSQIAQYFGEPLTALIDNLNQNLYSEGEVEWDGNALWQTCASYSPSQKEQAGQEAGNRLQPLNP